MKARATGGGGDPRTTFIYGVHATQEALAAAPQAVRRILLGNLRDQRLRDRLTAAAHKHGIALGAFDPKHPPRGLAADVTHQGVLAEIEPARLMRGFDGFLDGLVVTDDTLLVVLGELQDPQNVGAIIRSAAAFGASAVLIPEHRQAPVSGVAVKASAGMAFRIPLVAIGNVNTTLSRLKERGFWTYALTGEGGTVIDQEDFSKPSVLVVGGEGEGVREKTRETCDIALAIPLSERCESLNAAAATAVALYAWSRRHPPLVQGRT